MLVFNIFHCFASSFACLEALRPRGPHLCDPEDRNHAVQRTALQPGIAFKEGTYEKKKQCFFKDANCGNEVTYVILQSLLQFFYVSFCIFMYLYVSLCIFMYLFVSDVSLRIFMYLSNPFRKIRTQLYVSLCIFQNRSGRYVRIFTYLYVSFQPVSKDT